MTDALGASVSHITLVGSNQNASPVWTEETGKDGQPHAWSPYGHGNTDHFSLGFNGERIDPISRTYHLGNGYRAYNPTLMRFNCPDSLSPFGPGGINPYAYCAGDPINHTDPSGHISVGAGIGVGLGVVGILGGAFALFTGGTSIGVAGAIAAAIGFAADGTGIASAATEESDPQASATLGWVSLGLGIASGVVGAAPAVAKGLNNATAGLRKVVAGSKPATTAETGLTHLPVNAKSESAFETNAFMKIEERFYWAPTVDINQIKPASPLHAVPEGNAAIILHTKRTPQRTRRLFYRPQRELYMSPDELADVVRELPDFQKLEDNGYLILMSCYGGNLAQRFADSLKVKVVASKGKVWSNPLLDRHLLSAGAEEPFKIYYPSRP